MKKTAIIIIAAFFIILVSALALGGLYLDYLWFSSLGYASVLVTMLSNRILLQIVAFLLFFTFLFVNLLITKKTVANMTNLALRQTLMNSPAGNIISPKRLTVFFALISLVIAFVFTGYAGNFWLTLREFLSAQPFDIVDPLFGKDVSFFVFILPFYDFINQFLSGLLLITLVATATIYFLTSPPEFALKKLTFLYEGKGHLSMLLALFFILKAWDYRLASYGLVHSGRGVAFGASYTDVNAQLPAFYILMGFALLCALALLANIKFKKPKIIVFCVAGLIGASILVGGVYPAIVQRFLVEPNEFSREEEFIRHNIEFTRKAFGIDKIDSRDFPVTDTLTAEVIEENIETINNVRLWDYRPLEQTFNQIQGIRLYYRFLEVDTDRYMINGEYRQVMIAARELDQARLPEGSRTWINQHLQYTHGLGVAMSPVNEVAADGMPNYFIQDVPPQTVEGIELDRPQIYYGELTNDYVIVNALTEDFDNPMEDANDLTDDFDSLMEDAAYTTYDGDGGVLLGGIFRRILFALSTGDQQILLSGELTPESQVLFNRNIFERTEKIAPFLRFDRDPYMVVNDGRLFWIRDAYTTTNLYPYSEPFGNANYVRNSVKIVVDAYNGDVSYYVVDENDPIIATYQEIFPELFKPFSEMPESLRAHVRYPEELFNLQARVLSTYHMQNARLFYTREDQWQFPTEQYAGSSQTMEPYYTILKLPGEEEAEFVLMLPFTPNQRNNMIAWMAARMDGENYGDLVLYNFPQDRTVWGPQQIESRIDQSSDISQQLSLWDQRGSSVIRGNLLVLPIGDSILYVEPVYLQADQSEIPELTRVIVAYEDMVVMERTLEEGLTRIFGLVGTDPPEIIEPVEPAEPTEPGDEDEPDPGPSLPIEPGDLKQRIEKAGEIFLKAQESLQQGDWAEYGRLMQELEDILNLE